MRLTDADKLLEEWDERTDDHRITDSEFHRMINEDLPLIELGWHYPSKGDNPHVTGSYLVFAEGENGLQYAIGEYFAEENRKRWMNANEWHLELDGISGTFDPVAWMPLPEPPKEEA